MRWTHAARGILLVVWWCGLPGLSWAAEPEPASTDHARASIEHEQRIRELEAKVASATEVIGALRAELDALKREAGIPGNPLVGSPGEGAVRAIYLGDSTGMPLYQVKDVAAASDGAPGSTEDGAKPPTQQELEEQAAPGDQVPPTFTPSFLRDARALLLPRNTLQAQFGVGFSSLNRNLLTIQGLDIINSIFIGTITVEKLKQRSASASVQALYGITDTVQFGTRLSGSRIERSLEFPQGVQVIPQSNRLVETNGMGIGDVEADLSWNFSHEDGWIPDMVGTVLVKPPSAKSAFEVDRNVIAFGSGFWATRVGLTMVKVSDPATVFVSAGYFLNIPRTFSGVKYDPPDTIDIGAGLGYALNPFLSLTSRFNMRIVGETTINGRVAGNDFITATFGTGVAYGYSRTGSVSFSVGIGLTPDSPDFEVGLSFPFVFSLPEWY